jgi:hypothetical protein
VNLGICDRKPHSGRNYLKHGKTAKFVVFGLDLTIFEVILANLAMNPQKHDGRLLLVKIRETKFVNKI